MSTPIYVPGLPKSGHMLMSILKRVLDFGRDFGNGIYTRVLVSILNFQHILACL